MKSLPEDRARVRNNITKSVVFQLMYYVILYNFIPIPMPDLETLQQRLIFTLRCQLISVAVVPFLITDISLKRYRTTALDPIRGRGEHLVETKVRLLQNTMEQIFFHFVAQMVLCIYLTSASMKAVPILVSMFLIGRIGYKIGYEISPMKRSFGYSTTFFPTLATYFYCLFCMINYGPFYGI